ncbi:TPA: aromatic ring-cleaving dioxygenase, partial [Stenotrophomonas maltophilia]|nr:aromatic ring-cleaving dioxygenase [Stenotrophomonas maltophilia]
MHPDLDSPADTYIDASEDDAQWADLLSPARRRLIASAGLTAGGLASASTAAAATRDDHAVNTTEPGQPGFRAIVPPAAKGSSPWGQATAREPTPRPAS